MKNSANEGVQHTSGMYINQPPPGLALMEMNKATFSPPKQHPAAVAPIATLQKNQNTGQASTSPARKYTRDDVLKMIIPPYVGNKQGVNSGSKEAK
jgi:hypothetical protein